MKRAIASFATAATLLASAGPAMAYSNDHWVRNTQGRLVSPRIAKIEGRRAYRLRHRKDALVARYNSHLRRMPGYLTVTGGGERNTDPVTINRPTKRTIGHTQSGNVYNQGLSALHQGQPAHFNCRVGRRLRDTNIGRNAC